MAETVQAQADAEAKRRRQQQGEEEAPSLFTAEAIHRLPQRASGPRPPTYSTRLGLRFKV